MSDTITTQFSALQEFVAQAQATLPTNSWNYLIGGTETETAVRRNRHAIESIGLMPRVLNDVSDVSARCELFGKPSRLPVMLAPVGGLEAFDEAGALPVADAANRFGIPMFLSSVSPVPREEVRGAHHQCRNLPALCTRRGRLGGCRSQTRHRRRL